MHLLTQRVVPHLARANERTLVLVRNDALVRREEAGADLIVVEGGSAEKKDGRLKPSASSIEITPPAIIASTNTTQ